jgi:hypothetical protein
MSEPLPTDPPAAATAAPFLADRAVLVLGLMSYLVIFATLMGGLYLAIDATAGAIGPAPR